MRAHTTHQVCVFYLVLRGLDTIEDDMSIPQACSKGSRHLMLTLGQTACESTRAARVSQAHIRPYVQHGAHLATEVVILVASPQIGVRACHEGPLQGVDDQVSAGALPAEIAVFFF